MVAYPGPAGPGAVFPSTCGKRGHRGPDHRRMDCAARPSHVEMLRCFDASHRLAEGEALFHVSKLVMARDGQEPGFFLLPFPFPLRKSNLNGKKRSAVIFDEGSDCLSRSFPHVSTTVRSRPEASSVNRTRQGSPSSSTMATSMCQCSLSRRIAAIFTYLHKMKQLAITPVITCYNCYYNW